MQARNFALLALFACTAETDALDGMVPGGVGPGSADGPGNAADPSKDPTATPGSQAVDVSATPVRRLNRREYIDTVRDLLPGVAVDVTLLNSLPEDSSAPFDNDALSQAASQRLIESTNRLAEDFATKATVAGDSRTKLLGCTPAGNSDDACLGSFVKRFGSRVLRRPMTDAERDDYVSRFSPDGAAQKDFYVAVRSVVSALLQDIEFLYRVEAGEAIAGKPKEFALGDFAVASRLSYLLWGTMPDDALFDRAAKGQLKTAVERRSTAEAMLQDPRGKAQVSRFTAMWFGYQTALPNAQGLSDSLKTKLRAETDALVNKVVFESKAPWTDIFRATETFVDDELAKHYGDITAPGSATAKWTSYGKSQRQGILSHGSFLTVSAKFADTSPTQRGKVIRGRLLCTPPPPTPPELNVSTDSPPASAGKCKLDGYRAISKQAACVGCHKSMDGLGYGLERFDQAGRYRTQEAAGTACPIDGLGTFVSGGKEVAYSGPAELSNNMANEPALELCLDRRVLAFSNGRPVSSTDDATSLDGLKAIRVASGGRLDRMLIEIAGAPSFATKTNM
jgi:Protein of unknown function (DUF1592)/Protein of unknown function (DUF1588)/Protein of unknown function (DUF1595)/Protein of unknown function (DUF1587)